MCRLSTWGEAWAESMGSETHKNYSLKSPGIWYPSSGFGEKFKQMRCRFRDRELTSFSWSSVIVVWKKERRCAGFSCVGVNRLDEKLRVVLSCIRP